MSAIFPVCPHCGSDARSGGTFTYRELHDPHGDALRILVASTQLTCLVCPEEFPLWTYDRDGREIKSNLVDDNGKPWEPLDRPFFPSSGGPFWDESGEDDELAAQIDSGRDSGEVF